MPKLRFSCPKCTQVIECPDTNAGKKVACPICKAQLRVPALPAGARPTSRSAPAPSGQALQKEEGLDELEEVHELSRDEEPLDVLPAHESEDGAEVELAEAPDRTSKARARLGQKCKTYKSSTTSHIIIMVACVLLVGGGLVFIPIALLGKEPGFLVASVIMIPLGIIGFLYGLSMLGFQVIVCEGGLVQVRRSGERVILWDDIDSVWQQVTENYYNGIYTGTTYVYTLQLSDGTRLKYTNYTLNNVQKLGDTILHETSQVLYPRAIKAYNKGKTIDFGKLGVSEEGLSYGSALLPWDEIEAVRLKQGYVNVRKRGKWLNWSNIPLASIPNPAVFMSLVSQIVGFDNG